MCVLERLRIFEIDLLLSYVWSEHSPWNRNFWSWVWTSSSAIAWFGTISLSVKPFLFVSHISANFSVCLVQTAFSRHDQLSTSSGHSWHCGCPVTQEKVKASESANHCSHLFAFVQERSRISKELLLRRTWFPTVHWLYTACEYNQVQCLAAEKMDPCLINVWSLLVFELCV